MRAKAQAMQVDDWALLYKPDMSNVSIAGRILVDLIGL
jgi:hypothetical protein